MTSSNSWKKSRVRIVSRQPDEVAASRIQTQGWTYSHNLFLRPFTAIRCGILAFALVPEHIGLPTYSPPIGYEWVWRHGSMYNAFMGKREGQQYFCPYLGRLTNEPHNREHLIPEALGGPVSLNVRVSEKENSRFSKIDSELGKMPAISEKIVNFGIAGYRDVPPSKREFTTSEGVVVRTRLDQVGTTQATQRRILKDVSPTDDSNNLGNVHESGTITGTAKEMADSIAAMQQKSDKSGRELILGHEVIVDLQSAAETTPVDRLRIQQALLKIAFISTCYMFPRFAETKAITGWRRALVASTLEEWEDAGVRICDVHGELYKQLVGSPDPQEHTVAVYRRQDGNSINVCVDLFGGTQCFMVSLGDVRLGMPAGEARLLVCDAPLSRVHGYIKNAERVVEMDDPKRLISDSSSRMRRRLGGAVATALLISVALSGLLALINRRR